MMYGCKMCGCETVSVVRCEVCGSAMTDTSEADRLTRRYTAFATFQELVNVMGTPERQMYSPSIYPTNRYKGKKIPGKVRLAEIIRAAGFKVYDGVRVA